MTILSFSVLLIFFVTFFLGHMVYFEDKKSPMNWTFSSGCLVSALMIFEIFMTLQSRDAATALFWTKLQFVVFFIMPLFLHYILLFSKSAWLKYKLTYIILYIPPLIFGIIHYNMTELDPIKQWWGYTYIWRNTIWLYLRGLWIILEILIFVVLCFAHALRASGKEKTQVKYLGLTFLVFVLSGTLVYSISGILNIKYPEGLLFIVIALSVFLLIVYLMRRYRLFVINPTTAAENIISTMNESLILLDTNNKIVYVNLAAQNMLGFNRNELVGCPVNIVIQDESYQTEMAKSMDNGKSMNNCETEFTTKNGEKIPIILSSSLLKDESGDSGGMVIVARDISERKQAVRVLKESEEKYRLLIENAGAGIWIIDRNGNIEYINNVAQALMGVKSDDYSPKTLWDLFPKNLADAHFRTILNVINSQKGIIVENSITVQDQVRWFNINLQLIPDSVSGVSKVQIIANDITKLKQTEEVLINQAKKLSKSNTELQEFIFIASHDLQEPLLMITSFAIRLDAICFDSLTEQGRDYLLRMQNAVIRMQTLINDLLVYSQVTMKTQVYIPVNLAQIIKEALVDLDSQIGQTGGAVESGSLPIIEADPAQMRQLFRNLIENSLKFHKPEIPPVVRINSSIFDNEIEPFYEIIVEDNGIGMEEKYLERIFGVFQRLHGRDEYGGTGMGLAVCKKIVEQHGGSIKAQSRPEVGSQFIIRIPIKPVIQEI